MRMENIISYENNVMLAAILCLLIVILFVLLLHIYARWFLAEARQRQTRASLSMARVLGPARLGQEHSTTTYTYDVTSHSSVQTKGLDLMVIDSIPLFIYGSDGEGTTLECAICLSMFESREVGRSLPSCSHAFHVECIDMWLYSHSTCPICRAQVVKVGVDERKLKVSDEHDAVLAENDHVGATGNNDQRIEMEDTRSLAEVVVEIYEATAHENNNVVTSESVTLDCSLRRMLSRSRSENRVYPSFVGAGTQV